MDSELDPSAEERGEARDEVEVGQVDGESSEAFLSEDGGDGHHSRGRACRERSDEAGLREHLEGAAVSHGSHLAVRG
jgi:hypothetical protein